MNTIRNSYSLISLLSRSQIRNARSFTTTPAIKRSPLLELFLRHQSRPSIRQQLARRRFTSRSRLRDGLPNTSESRVVPSKSLTQRLKDLSREYGWTAVGVYFTLSALDFPFCFLAVRLIGTDKIAALEHSVVEWVKRASPIQVPEKYRFWQKPQVEQVIGQIEVDAYDHGVKEAEKANKGEGASTLKLFLLVLGYANILRYWDTTCISICYTQIVYFHSSSLDSSYITQDSQDTERMGLGNWKEEAKDRQGGFQIRSQQDGMRTPCEDVATQYSPLKSSSTYRGACYILGISPYADPINYTNIYIWIAAPASVLDIC